MALEVPLLVQRSTATPTRPPDSGWEVVPLVLFPVAVIGVGAAIALWLRHRGDGGWALTPWRAAGIPIAVAAAQLLTVSLHDPAVVLDPFTWPYTILAAIYGLGIVGGAALGRRRWDYLAAAGSATAIGTLLAASWVAGPGVHRPYLYVALVAVGLGLLPGYVTAGRREPSG